MLDEGTREALEAIHAARAALASLEATLVARARESGATWTELGEPLRLSKQGVRRRHLAIDPIVARRPTRAPSFDEFYAEMDAFIRAEQGSGG